MQVAEGELVERLVDGASFRVLLTELQSRSDLDDEAALRLAVEETRAARAERAARDTARP